MKKKKEGGSCDGVTGGWGMGFLVSGDVAGQGTLCSVLLWEIFPY